MSAPPLVSVGFAVRNSVSRHGRSAVERVIRSMREQTYGRLEIIVGDNGSTDGTPELCAAWAREDARVRIIRHDPAVTAQANFIHLFKMATGKYFTCMADDDFRTANYIETLVGGLERHPEAALAFSDQREFSDLAAPEVGWEVQRPFVTAGLTRGERLRQMPKGTCTHLAYGLLRREVLNQYQWRELDNSSFDVPLGYYLSLRTEMVYVPGACFYRYIPREAKTVKVQAAVNNFAPLRRFFPERMCWSCCQAAAQGARQAGRPVPAWWLFPQIYYAQHQGWTGILVRVAPAWLYRAWRRLRHGSTANLV